MRRGSRLGGLRSRLEILVLVTLLPVVAASTLATLRQRATARDQLVAEARRAAAAITMDLDRIISTTHHLLSALQELPEVRAGGRGCQAALRSFLGVHPFLTDLGLVDSAGRPVCAAVAPQNAAGAGWLTRVSTERDFVIGGSRRQPGNAQRELILAHPVFETDQVQGALFATFNLEWIDQLLVARTIASPAVANVIDGDGVIIYRSEQPASFVGTRPSVESLERIRRSEATGTDSVGLDGVSRRYFVSMWGSEGRNPLTFVVGFPTAIALRRFNETLRTQLLFLAIGVLVATLGVNRAAQRLVLNPVEALVAATARVRAGDLSTRVTPAGGNELRELSAAFNLTVEALQRGRELEEQLRRAQGLQAIGQLAGGVAHEFNNMLTVIIGHTDMLLESDPDRPELRAIRDAAEHSRVLTQQLLAFSRQQLLQPKRALINSLVHSAVAAFGSTLDSRMTVKLELAPGEPGVTVDRAQFEHVLLNVLLNARDAMPQGGDLLIGTAVKTIENGSIPGLPDGQYVELTVKDSGHGMDADTLARAMEPFFTTRPFGKAAGLGLSTAYGIIRQSGGELTLSSMEGAGTTVRIYLPLADHVGREEA